MRDPSGAGLNKQSQIQEEMTLRETVIRLRHATDEVVTLRVTLEALVIAMHNVYHQRLKGVAKRPWEDCEMMTCKMVKAALMDGERTDEQRQEQTRQ